MNIAGEDSDHDFSLAVLSELDELLTRVGPTRHKDVAYLLNLWRWFSIHQVDPALLEQGSVAVNRGDAAMGASGSGERSLPRVVRVTDGWKVLDYDDGLITSAGENYAAYSSTGPLLKTVGYMVACLAKRDVKAVVFAGSLAARRFAWIECMRHGLRNRFSPNKQDLQCQEGLSKLLAGGRFSTY